MGGIFAAASKKDCVFDLFFGTDYHSHLGTRRAGLAVFDPKTGFNRAIHNIENAPFRTKFDSDVGKMAGNLGIGAISDYEPQPLIVRSHHGTYAITTVGKVNNIPEIEQELVKNGTAQFLEMSGGALNQTELIAMLINQKANLVEGIRYAQEKIDGSITLFIMTPMGIYCARDLLGRTPLVIGKKKDGYCASFESFAYLNLGYKDYKELGPGEIVVMTPEVVTTLVKPGKEMRICSFLWVYYGYPSSRYEGISVEQMRYNCGIKMAERDAENLKAPGTTSGLKEYYDAVAGIPDSGMAHAIGYSNASEVPLTRPFIKYTPTWPRSFMPTMQEQRNLIAKMKLIPIQELIENERLLLIDDSIVRGTQLRETAEFLFSSGAKEVHVRPACPPLLFGCKYINFSRSTSEMDLITRRMIAKEEGQDVSRDILDEYVNPDSERYHKMIKDISKEMNFTSLNFNRLDDLISAIGLPKEKLCTYCWDGRE